jgi:hypothetical protein
MSARGLLALCLALVAAAPLSAQQRDVTGLFDDAGAAAGEAEAIGAPEDAGATSGAAPEPPGSGEPALAPEDDAPALPDGHVPTLTVRLTPDSGLMTGDVVHYELTVEVPDGDDVNLPRQSYAPLELVGQDHTESAANGRRRFVYTLDLLALAPGEITIAPLTVRVITADGVVGIVRTEAQRVSVGSLVANEPDAQPRPPTEPVVVMQDDYTLAYLAGALGLMALSALLTWLFLRWWRARPKELPPPPPPRPAQEIALEKLRALRRELTAAIADGSQARIVDGASDALREYLGHRFGFNGLESTTDEVIARMRQQRLVGLTLAEITTLLGECDLVKFAKAVPDQADCERVIGEAERIVQRTMSTHVVAIAPPAPPSAPTMKEPSIASPSEAPRPDRLGPPGKPEPRHEDGVSRAEASARGAADAARVIPLTNPPPAQASEPLRPAGSLSFAIPETPVPPPSPRESEPARLVPATSEELLAKLGQALRQASGGAAKPSDDTAKPSDDTAKPSDDTAKPSDDTAKPSDDTAKSSDVPASSFSAAAATQGPARAANLDEENVWSALDEAVAMDRLVVGKVIARREEGWLVGLGAGVHGVLPEPQLGGLDAERLVGEERAFRVVSLNATRKRVVLSHRDVDPAAERALVGRSTPVGFSDPAGGTHGGGAA